MSLLDIPVFLIDCQTTGMRPSSGHLLELAWCQVRAEVDEPPRIFSRLVRLPEGEFIPTRVSEITGITEADLVGALVRDQVRGEFAALFATDGARPVAIIHYAQFERPFLLELMGETDTLPFDVICSYQLSKRLFPHLPSRNIRGLSGYFGGHSPELKRAESHVLATHEIWRGLARELTHRGIQDFASLTQWLKEKPEAKPKLRSASYEYRIEKEKRLALPDRPGIYRMIAKSGEVLYVGKATSLHDRVNSYFRGKRGRDKRKLELMAQVWDLQVTECPTALEAAILESDEIKRLNPPYNVSLKTGQRRLIYYSRDFDQATAQQDEAHPLGPFRRFNQVERLIMLAQSLRSDVFAQVFYDVFPESLLSAGFQIFLRRHRQTAMALANVRSLLALGLKISRARAVVEPEPEPEPEDGEENVEISPEEMADKFERLLMRGAAELRRARRMTRVLNARVRWQAGETWVSLQTRQGRIVSQGNFTAEKFPWQGLDIADYDRMSVLVSELAKYVHEIEPARTP